MRLMLNDGESVTIQCNHVLSGDQVMAHSFTFSNHGGELCGREFNAAQKNGEAPETIDNNRSDLIAEMEKTATGYIRAGYLGTGTQIREWVRQLSTCR